MNEPNYSADDYALDHDLIFMERDNSLNGRWAVCSIGRLGRIEGQKELEWGLSYVGRGVNGTLWASKNPTVINEADSNLLNIMYGYEVIHES